LCDGVANFVGHDYGFYVLD